MGRICDEGRTITFSDVMAVVHSKDGSEHAKFHRTNGGLYVAKLKLKRLLLNFSSKRNFIELLKILPYYLAYRHLCLYRCKHMIHENFGVIRAFF